MTENLYKYLWTISLFDVSYPHGRFAYSCTTDDKAVGVALLRPQMTAQKDHETEWKRIQTKTFTRWCNEHLKVQGVEIEDLGTAFCDGVNLIVLLEVLSGKSVGRFNRKPKRLVQSMENVSLALDFITKTEKIKLVNIG